jgi:hypothetical protein
MRSLRRIVLVVAGAVAGLLAVLILIGVLSQPERYRVPDSDIMRHVAGRWDWSTRLDPCRDSAHVIAFSPDKKVMTITLGYLPASDADRITTYDLSVVTSSSIRGAIRGETRKTNAGVPVVWDLVLVGPNTYRWHRTDWNRSGFTQAVIRCDSL